MKLLILGESESAGMALLDPQVGWGNQLPREIEALTGEPVEAELFRYYPWASNHLEYLEEILRHGPFDAVCCSITKVGFTVYSADNRVRKVLGNRAADWLKGSVRTLDRTTLWRQESNWKRRVNASLHAAGRKVIGQAPSTSAKAVLNGYTQTFARLARLEDTRIVVVNTSNVSRLFVERHPELANIVPEFQAGIRRAAERRRLECVDRNPLLLPPERDSEATFRDGIHRQDEVHTRLAKALAGVFANGGPA